jgi:hypothetical protein
VYEYVRLPLTPDAASLAPDEAGVFILWNEKKPIYVGLATKNYNLRQVLVDAALNLLPVMKIKKIKKVDAFSFELASNLTERFAEIHEQVQAEHGL